MTFHPITLGALAAGGLAALLGPIDAPVTTRYRVDQTLSQEIDASVVGGAKQQLNFTTSSFITVTLDDSAGGKTMRIVLDSIRGDSATPIPAAVLDSARGSEFRGFVTPTGTLDRLVPVTDRPAARQVQGFLSDFFPWVKAGLKVGDTWADTTAKTGGEGTDSVTVRRVTSYKAAANETRDASKALRITTDFTSSVNGTQPTPNGPAKVEGAGRGSGAYFVGLDGRYLGGDWEQRSALRISGSFIPKPLPVTLVQTTKVTALK